MRIGTGRRRKAHANDTLVKVARSVGATLGTVAAETKRLRKTSRKITAGAGALAKKARKRTTSFVRARRRARRRR